MKLRFTSNLITNAYKKPLILGIIGVILLVPVIIFAIMAAMHQTISIDMPIIHFIYMLRGKRLTSLMFSISKLGKEYLYPLIIIFFLFLLSCRKLKLFGFYGLLMIFGMTIYFVLLNLVHRGRPNFLPIYHETYFSFPSGHTLQSSLFYLCVMHSVYTLTRNKLLILLAAVFLTLIIIGIGVSRIYLGVHYPTDVLAGLFISLGAFCLAISLKKFFHIRSKYIYEG